MIRINGCASRSARPHRQMTPSVRDALPHIVAGHFRIRRLPVHMMSVSGTMLSTRSAVS
jgi:hypothetical protein